MSLELVVSNGPSRAAIQTPRSVVRKTSHLPWQTHDPSRGQLLLAEVGYRTLRRAITGEISLRNEAVLGEVRAKIRKEVVAPYCEPWDRDIELAPWIYADQASAWAYVSLVVALLSPARTFEAHIDVGRFHKSKFSPAELAAQSLRSSLGRRPFSLGIVRLPNASLYHIRGVVGVRSLADGHLARAIGCAFRAEYFKDVYLTDAASFEASIRRFSQLRMSQEDPHKVTGIVSTPKVLALAESLYEQDSCELRREQRRGKKIFRSRSD